MKHLFKILILFSFTKVCCQQSNYLAIYDNYVGIENLNLYHGKVFIPQILTVKNHHPFLNVNFNEGQVFYDNQLYTSTLKYDIYNDIVIVKLPQKEQSLSFSLNSKLVTEFNFNHRTFVKLPKKEVLLSFYKNGFFERIHRGSNIDFYIKHTKKKAKRVNDNAVRYKFLDKKFYILKINQSFYKIHKKSDVIKALPKFKKEINLIFKNYKKVNSQSLLKLTKQIDAKL